MRKIVSVGLIAMLSACAVSRVDPLAVPLVYKSSTTPLIARAASCPAISLIEVDDRRTDKLLGVRFHENKPLKADVTAASDPTMWVHDGMQAFLSRNGLKLDSTGPKMVVEIRGLKTQENIWHRSGYEAKIALTARLQSPAGKICAEQAADGKGGNYGYSASIENYQETLNAALDDAAQHLLDSPLFSSTNCQCGN